VYLVGLHKHSETCVTFSTAMLLAHAEILSAK
jgi:hypothetical protein